MSSGRAGAADDRTIVVVSPTLYDISSFKYLFELQTSCKVLPRSPTSSLLLYFGNVINLQWPIFVQPAHDGSSFGEGKLIETQERLRKGIDSGCRFNKSRCCVLCYEHKSGFYNFTVYMNHEGLFSLDTKGEDREFKLITEHQKDDCVRFVQICSTTQHTKTNVFTTAVKSPCTAVGRAFIRKVGRALLKVYDSLKHYFMSRFSSHAAFLTRSELVDSA